MARAGKLSVRLPLGGYVQFKGDMDPASIPHPEEAAKASPEERDGSFHHASLGQRALIVFAGPAMNIIVTSGDLRQLLHDVRQARPGKSSKSR